MWVLYNIKVRYAGVMELVDVADSKSAAGDSVPVRVRSPAPEKSTLSRAFFNDVCPYGQMMPASAMMLPSPMMCAFGTWANITSW